VLGNDPFERGAAPRPPVERPAAEATAQGPEPLQGSAPPGGRAAPPPDGRGAGPASPPEPEGPPPESTTADWARELGEMAASLLPAMRERLLALGGLFRLGKAGGPLDAHGMDPTLLARASPLLDFLYLSWWRVEASSAARLPSGPLVVVANRGGLLPWDALVLRLAARREARGRDLRPLLDAAFLERPLLGRAALRLGAVPAAPGNALEILARGDAVGVFPEGSAPRPWPQRHRIGAFGRGGFVKIALRARARIVPCAIVGSEEASPPLGRPGFLADALGLPALAATPGLPLGPLGGLPLPSRWKLVFGEPVEQAGLGPEDADRPEVVARLTAEVRDRLQAMLDQALAARTSIFL
jgi:1-acyl-sn-glycerol-3-phosphate acyltransferase